MSCGTPLAALTAAAEVLDRRRNQLDARSQQALDILTNQLRRFSGLVLDLLEMSRIDSGVVDLHPEPVAITPLVRKVAANSNAPQLDVESGPGMDDAQAVVDKRRFERLLFNLLENAERYGGGPVRIRVEGQDGTVRVHVDDAGPGIPTGERQRIFERFSRGSTTQGVPGTGLGLALVAEHAHLMKGSASVGDSPEGGARFTLSLPDRIASERRPDPSSGNRRPVGGCADGGRGRPGVGRGRGGRLRRARRRPGPHDRHGGHPLRAGRPVDHDHVDAVHAGLPSDRLLDHHPPGRAGAAVLRP